MSITAAKLMTEVGADTSAAEKGVAGFGNKLNSMAKSMATTGSGLSLAITAPLMGIAAAAISSASEFEQNMNVLQQVVGATSTDMASMQAEALRLGAVTSFSAGEAAEAMLELGKAGMGTQDIMASIGGVLDLAAAGGIGLAEAANITANALNAFHLEASESSRVANLLAATANASSADISDLAQGMQQAGFAFANANQPIENLAAALAILTNVGLTGADAGTALKNAFMRMMNPTQEATAVMNELGISFYDAQGNMKALPDIIDMLNTATAGLTNEQRDAALSTILMSDGMKAMLPLMDQGSVGFNEMVTSVTQAGAASDVAGARMKGLSGGIEYLKGSVDSFLIGAALPFLSTLGDLARGAGDLLTQVGTLPQPILNAALAFGAVLAATGPLMLAISGLTAALGFLLSPIGLVIAGVALLASAWTLNIGGIQEITATTFGAAQEWFTTTAEGATALASSIATAFGNTSFPSLESLWADFQAGDFETLATKIKSTAYELMVNLDTELDITAKAQSLKSTLDQRAAEIDAFGLNMVSGLTDQLGSIDWTQMSVDFAGMIDSLTTSIASIDWTTIGSDTATFILNSLSTGIAGLGALLMGESGIEGGVKASVANALNNIDWGSLGLSFVGLGIAVNNAIFDLQAGIGQAIIEFPAPPWVEDLKTFAPVKPQWAVDLDAWGLESIDAIEEFAWEDWIEKLAWPLETIGGFVWSTFVSVLTWPLPTIDAFSWETWLDALLWPTSVIDAFSWETWLDALTWPTNIFGFEWSDFVPHLHWPTIPAFNWGDFIQSINPFAGTPPSSQSVNAQSIGVPVSTVARVSSFGGAPMLAGAGGVTIHVHATLNNEIDVETLVNKIATRFKQQMR